MRVVRRLTPFIIIVGLCPIPLRGAPSFAGTPTSSPEVVYTPTITATGTVANPSAPIATGTWTTTASFVITPTVTPSGTVTPEFTPPPTIPSASNPVSPMASPATPPVAKAQAPAAGKKPFEFPLGCSLGAGWPYVGLKWHFKRDWAAEARYATGDGINVYSARGYWRFAKSGSLGLFTGVEGGPLTFHETMNAFNTARVTGKGYVLCPFLGGEYYFSRRFSFSMDFSLLYVNVTSGKTNLDGIHQWVCNTGVYCLLF